MADSDRYGTAAPAVWGNVPQRNASFTGRSDLLYRLRSQLVEQKDAVVLHALQGYGGVGKTHLAIEYIYRFSGDYELIWWVPADQPPLLRGSLAALAPRLGITDIPAGRQEDVIDAVREKLRRGEPYKRWLVVFDNADQPEDLQDVLPKANGHVLITSRNHRWQSRAMVLDVDVFMRVESMEFLRRRVPGISDYDADRLAEELGDLPLALEQAGALMAETAMSVETYLSELERAASKILAQGTPLDYPVPVAAAWSISLERITRQEPSAMELLYRIAYFGPEPIPLDLINLGRHVLSDSELRNTIKDPYRMSNAIRELGRYALARIDNLRRSLQMHRIIQTLIKEGLSENEGKAVRHDVHLLLAAADPDRPDELDSWQAYEDLLPHIYPSQIIECTYQDARRLVTNMARYLLVKGDLKACAEWVDRALEDWQRTSKENDLHLLILRRLKANLLLVQGYHQQALEVSRDTLERFQAAYGYDHDETLIMTNIHGGILRWLGQFASALEADQDALELHERVFGTNHPNTQRVLSNLAIDNTLATRYEDALALDRRGYELRRDYYGSDAHWRVAFSNNAVARDLRLLGRYAEAREHSERVYGIYQDLVRQRVLGVNHPDVLNQARELAIARRKAGAFDEALSLAREVFHRQRDTYGRANPTTLAAALTLANCQRLVKDYDPSAAFATETAERYGEVLGPHHPFTLGAALNTALALRLLGESDEAETTLRSALARFTATLGERHHYTLTCATNLASVLSGRDEVAEARKIGEAAAAGLRDVLGEDHPHALACAANLALDLEAVGEAERARDLRDDVIKRFGRTLGENYPDVIAVAHHERLDFDFEPPAV
ncbi:hypothetical protein Aph01nite_53920 [Acrocarpospora phusangensis]|uniref:NB-ARC domain-containing protein n=1 Tax=Acrocarpospora phusangensis TaxID=1070424 RepID=A0A919QDR8_9ACTN|nr:FxSxx-COOH system tetratricopeptide repeat protein [Acrocarpospora phusangensis]GIH27082.1 hypothetical protein Aph01nite_53920 [Acrocarpospora phusangensis]